VRRNTVIAGLFQAVRRGRRLRAAGVSFEDRQDLLGHRSTRVTTDYSAAELRNLLNAANRLKKSRKSPAMTVLRLTG
jgi:hypothetical protein